MEGPGCPVGSPEWETPDPTATLPWPPPSDCLISPLPTPAFSAPLLSASLLFL